VGDVVLAVGNPLGVGQTVTMGIISAKGRATGTGDGSYEDFLQTDAPINHGNSGGALVNTKGELVGINSQILSNTGENIGIGFAIPANMARNVADQLRKDGKVRRSQLGVTIQPVTSDMAASLGLKDVGGVIISSIEPGSAASTRLRLIVVTPTRELAHQVAGVAEALGGVGKHKDPARALRVLKVSLAPRCGTSRDIRFAPTRSPSLSPFCLLARRAPPCACSASPTAPRPPSTSFWARTRRSSASRS
jgi:hypothetical protein